MNMATALMSGALRSLNDQVIAESLGGTARALIDFCGNLRQNALPDVLKNTGLALTERLDGWALPDAVWSAICHQQPHLNCYPLGEIAERAIKKTFISLTLPTAAAAATGAYLKLGQRAIQENLRGALKTHGQNGLRRLFLSHYFFEMCIDYLRRPSKDIGFDWSYGYHFSKGKRMVSWAAERKLRETLARQCEASAARFLAFLQKGLSEKNSEYVERRLGNGFAKVFKARPPRHKKAQNQGEPFINVIVGTRSVASLKTSFVVDRKMKRLLLHADHANVSFSFETLELGLERPLHSLVKDLLDIGVAVYMSDLYTRRRHDLGRQMGLLMPVRHPALWSDAQMEIERAVASLGRDDFSIHFVKRKEHADKDHGFSIKTDKRCVCLFSGGLDSMAGAVWALDGGLKPIFVSHHASPYLDHIQKSLIKQLGKIYGRKLRHFDVFVAKARSWKARYRLSAPPHSIMAQYLRSFLFLSLAAAVALESGISTIYVFENGPVALNPLFSEARVNTRTAHPHFLAYFRTLIKTLFGVELYIENPFVYLTKGEVVKFLAKPELHRLVAQTNSCWNWFNVLVRAKRLGITGFQGKHDGDCFPCIHRRTAVHRAGLGDWDDEYLTDVFKAYPYPNQNQGTIVEVADFIRFCRNVISLSDAELLLRAPDLSVYEEGVRAQKFVRMYRRHAQEVIRCFRARANEKLRQDFAAVLNG